MGQVLTAGKPGLPATDHGDFDVFSCRRGRTSTAVYMEGRWCTGRSGATTDADIGQRPNR